MHDNHSDFLDESFDARLQATILPWLPWVGSEYGRAGTRTVVLGECTGEQGPRETAVRRRILHRDGAGQPVHAELTYLRAFERTALRKHRPGRTERMRLWSRLAYHNLVLRVLPSVHERPSRYDYEVGWEAFLELSEVLRAQRCLVFGWDRAKIETLEQVLASRGAPARERALPAAGAHTPLALAIPLGGETLEVVFAHNPGPGLSWKRWGDVLHATGVLPAAPVARGKP